MKQTGVSVRIITFDGGAQMVLAGLGGNCDVFGGTPNMLYPYIKSGKVKPFAYFDKQRSPDYPDVPTAIELGFNMSALQWRGMAAPKGTPRAVLNKLGAAFKKMTEDESVKAMMQKTGQGIQFLGPDEFDKFWRADYEFYKELKPLFGK